MKARIQIAIVWVLFAIVATIPFSTARAQSTAFTYQGRLNDGQNPANGSYDFTFTVFDSNTNGVQQGPIVTNTATAVNNGLFTVSLDFGNQFSGASRWLQVAVCTNGAGNFVPLTPRQLLTATPYALTASTIVPGGIPAGTYTNPIIFNNVQISGNGAGVTNVPLAGLSQAAQTQLTNIANAAAASVQNNLNALSSGALDTNLFGTLSRDHLLVAPYTNLPAYLLASPYYFSPVKGPDYIQQAINSLPVYHDRQHVGGGEICVLGINYFPTTLQFTNSGLNGNIMTYKLYSPSFTSAALVCQVNPCIHAYGYGNNGYGSDTAFAMDNLIVSTLQNTTAVLFDLDFNVTDSDVEHCWFGYWPYLTNQICVGYQQGLATPNTPEGITVNDLVVKYTPGNTDRHIFSNNHLTGINCLLIDADHFQCDFNFFMECGGNSSIGVRTTDWPVATPTPGQWQPQWATLMWTGAAVVMAQDEPHRNYTFTDNYFYFCGGAYFSAWQQPNFHSYQDSYEGTRYSSLTYAGTQFNMINSDAEADSYTLNSDNSMSDDYGVRGGVWVDASRFPYTRNGSALTNLSASSITGKLPVADLSGVSTNLSINGVTLHVTNGLIMSVTAP